MTAVSLRESLQTIEASLDGGRLGVAAKFLTTGETVDYNADTVFPTASTIKSAIVAELYTQLSEGRLPEAWFEHPTVLLKVEDQVGGSGILAHLQTPELRLSLADLALLAMKVSDNTASNLCLQMVGGPAAVNVRMSTIWAMGETHIHRPIKFQLTPDDPPYTATGTPRDMCHLMELAALGNLHNSFVSGKVRELLATVNDAEMLPRYLNVNYYAKDLESNTPLFQVIHKPGAVTGVRNDAGIISRGDQALAICVYSKDCPDTVWTPANKGTEAVAQVSRLLCSHFF